MTNCNTAINGLISIEQVNIMEDTDSIYEYNSGLDGGVFALTGGNVISTISITSCSFSYNYGSSGGTISATAYFKITISSCSFILNGAD